MPTRAMKALKRQTLRKMLLKVGLAGKALCPTARGHAPVGADGKVHSGGEKGLWGEAV